MARDSVSNSSLTRHEKSPSHESPCVLAWKPTRTRTCTSTPRPPLCRPNSLERTRSVLDRCKIVSEAVPNQAARRIEQGVTEFRDSHNSLTGRTKGAVAQNCIIKGIRNLRLIAKVAELADAPDLGSGGETHGGSSPPFRTKNFAQARAERPALEHAAADKMHDLQAIALL